MAKKKFNISSTLKKNKKEEIKLAPKVPLKKTPKDLDEIKEKVEEIHYKEQELESTKVSEPITPELSKPATPKPTGSKPTSPKPKKDQKIEKPKIVRMTIDTPEEIHLKLKIKSIQARTTMRDYVLALIEKDLKKG